RSVGFQHAQPATSLNPSNFMTSKTLMNYTHFKETGRLFRAYEVQPLSALESPQLTVLALASGN
ncbi:hypothetical protein HispidOSU_001456, partial [Sigmodon hispidus]